MLFTRTVCELGRSFPHLTSLSSRAHRDVERDLQFLDHLLGGEVGHQRTREEAHDREVGGPLGDGQVGEGLESAQILLRLTHEPRVPLGQAAGLRSSSVRNASGWVKAAKWLAPS